MQSIIWRSTKAKGGGRGSRAELWGKVFPGKRNRDGKEPGMRGTGKRPVWLQQVVEGERQELKTEADWESGHLGLPQPLQGPGLDLWAKWEALTEAEREMVPSGSQQLLRQEQTKKKFVCFKYSARMAWHKHVIFVSLSYTLMAVCWGLSYSPSPVQEPTLSPSATYGSRKFANSHEECVCVIVCARSCMQAVSWVSTS